MRMFTERSASNLPQFLTQSARVTSPHRCHIRVTLSSLTYFCILATDHCLAQLSISILRDLLCQKHTLSHAPLGQTLTLNSSYAAAFASFHPSNPHNQSAFLLICPTTTHSRNTEHAVRTLLHMKVGTCFHTFRSCTASVQLLSFYVRPLYHFLNLLLSCSVI